MVPAAEIEAGNFDKIRDIVQNNTSNPEETIEKIPDEIELAPDDEIQEDSHEVESDTSDPIGEVIPEEPSTVEKNTDHHITLSENPEEEKVDDTKSYTPSPLVGNPTKPVEFSNSMMEYMMRKKGTKVDLNNPDLM